jgi:PAS fold.
MPGERDRIDGHDLLDSLSDALFAVDSDRRLSYANRRLLEVLDVPREALLSEPLAALEPFIDRGFDDLGSAVDDVRSGAGERRVEIEATLPDAAPSPGTSPSTPGSPPSPSTASRARS